VTGELVAATEALATAWMVTSMWLFAGVGANVASLVFEAVEGARAEWALVWTGYVGLVYAWVAVGSEVTTPVLVACVHGDL